MKKRGVALVEIVVSMLILAVSALAVTATISMVNNAQQRSAGGSSIDLQALGFARETLESLKNNVSVDETAGIGNGRFLVGTSEGKVYTATENPALTIPATSDLGKSVYAATRTYKVWNIDENSDGITDFKKVTVSVNWND